ncbi:MAG TPA: hypothetical protein VGL05_36795 [Kribbella sp.]
MLIGTTACSGKSDDAKTPSSSTSTSTSATPTATSRTPSTSTAAETLPDLTAAQVVAAFAGQKYQCATDEAYETCSKGTTSVQVLIGTQPRPAVLSLQATGAPAEAATALAEFAPQALELAHVNPRAKIVDWLKQQQGKAAGTTTAGNWTVEFSTESGTERPGAILTLTDKLCKANCGAE